MSKKNACRIMCTGTPEGGGMAETLIPLSFKRGATGAEWPFHHRFRSRQIFGAAKDFCPNFSKLPRNVFCATFVYKFFSTKIIQTFFGVTSKKVFMCFLQILGTIFWSQAMLGAIFTQIFSDVAQIFSKSQLLGMCLHPLHPHFQHHGFS